MENTDLSELLKDLPTPCFVVDEAGLKKNLEILKGITGRTGAEILLAQKAFSMFSLYPLIGEYLSGTAASGLFEAKLGYEYMKKENHIFSPAYKEEEFDEIVRICDHIIFNSFSQWEKFSGLLRGRSAGIRINPECSTQTHGIYDPCAEFSRLGVTIANFPEKLPSGIEGFHFHTLCEQDSDALEITLDAVEKKFGKYLNNIKWLNFGGGHHITRKGYDICRLERCINRMKKYDVRIYLEPGEAVVLNCGYLISSVADILHNGMDIAIADASAACHMPDVLEMPYRPEIIGAGAAGEKEYTFRIGSVTCLAGDIIGDYSFDRPLKAGDKLIFTDMALYTMVKTNTFNGINLPSIALLHEDGSTEIIKKFGYEDFKSRLS